MLREHDRCTRLTLDINSWMKDLLFPFYYLMVPGIDFAIMFVIYESNIVFRLVGGLLASLVVVNLFALSLLLSSVVTEAHKSYAFLNSMIVRKRLILRLKFKTLSLIERLSGPLIGIYCYDLFPFTNYEFYLFCVNCISNFFLFVGLLMS